MDQQNVLKNEEQVVLTKDETVLLLGKQKHPWTMFTQLKSNGMRMTTFGHFNMRYVQRVLNNSQRFVTTEDKVIDQLPWTVLIPESCSKGLRMAIDAHFISKLDVDPEKKFYNRS